MYGRSERLKTVQRFFFWGPQLLAITSIFAYMNGAKIKLMSLFRDACSFAPPVLF